MYSSTLTLTPALGGVGGQRHAPAVLPRAKTRYPLYRRLGEPQGRSWRVRKISLPPGFDPRTVQPVASRYTDWAIQAQTLVFFLNDFKFLSLSGPSCRSQWPRGLRRRSAAARLLRSWVRIPPGAWMFVCRDCRVLSGRGLCDELITRPEESYRMWCVVVCDLETTEFTRPWPTGGCCAPPPKKSIMTRVGSQGHSKKKKL